MDKHCLPRLGLGSQNERLVGGEERNSQRCSLGAFSQAHPNHYLSDQTKTTWFIYLGKRQPWMKWENISGIGNNKLGKGCNDDQFQTLTPNHLKCRIRMWTRSMIGNINLGI